MKPINVLFATRAIESPPHEGGFVLLKDIATSFANSTIIEPYFFSATITDSNLQTKKIFSDIGWNTKQRNEFLRGIFKTAHLFDVVQTAHIPTKQNVLLIKLATKRARRQGTKFVQTITGLPKVDISQKELKKLLWGDHIVCQSEKTFQQVSKLHDHVSLICPWPPKKRIAYDAARRTKTRAQFLGAKHIVVFPGEFDRLGVDVSFAEALKLFLQKTPNSIVLLACRFDSRGTGKILAEKFPGRVFSVGQTSEIIPLLEAADLVIFPSKKMDSKFQPPLVITESLQLGTTVAISEQIDLSEANIFTADVSKNWIAFAEIMSTALKNQTIRAETTDKHFQKMTADYQSIYENIVA